MAVDLTPKQKKFSDEYLDNGGNGTQAVKDAGYDVKNDNSAAVVGSSNLRKVKIQEYLEEQADGASSRVVELSKNAESEQVKLSANKDILDRAGFKPTENIDIKSGGEKISKPEWYKDFESSFIDKLKNGNRGTITSRE